MHHRPSSRPTLLAGALATSAMFGACSIESPEMPSFESEWRVPVGVFEKTVSEMIGDEENFVVGADGLLSVQTSGELDAVTLGDQLDAEVDGISLSAEIGPISLEPSDPVDFDYRLGELFPPAEMLDGVSTPVPTFTFDLASAPQDLPGFRSATLESGGLDVTIVNGLPVDVGGAAPPEQIELALVDPENGTVLQSLVVDGPIAAGTGWSRTLDLSGRTLPDSVAVELTGGSMGSGTDPVDIDADAQLAIRVRTSAMTVLSADAEFGAQNFEESTRLALDDSIRIVHAAIASGDLTVRVRNDLPVPATADLGIDALRTTSGAAFALRIPLAPGATETRSVDLAGYALDFGDAPGEELEVLAMLSTVGSQGAAVNIDATDVVSVDVDPITLSFDSVEGIVDPMSIDLENSTTLIELPDELEDLRLAQAELRLAIASTVGMPGTIDLELLGVNDDGAAVPLDVHVDLPAAMPGETVLHSVLLNETNSDILDFLNNLPTRIEVSGRATAGDGVTAGTIAVDDSLTARWSIDAPMTVQLLSQTVDIDAQLLDLGESLREQLDERLISLELDAEVTSTLPVGAVAWIGIDSDSTRVHEDPELLLGPIEIVAAPALRDDGSRDLARSVSTIALDEADVPAVTQPVAWQAVRVEIPGSDGRFVTLRASDSIAVRGFLRARILVGEAQ